MIIRVAIKAASMNKESRAKRCAPARTRARFGADKRKQRPSNLLTPEFVIMPYKPTVKSKIASSAYIFYSDFVFFFGIDKPKAIDRASVASSSMSLGLKFQTRLIVIIFDFAIAN